MGQKDMAKKRVTVVLPVFNEEKIIEKLATEIEKKVEHQLEFIFINDGSSDNTLAVLKSYLPKKKDTQKKIIDLTRNFGHQPALMAGLSSVSTDSDIVLVMDADFQDLPEDIPKLIKKLEEGYDCVYAIRTANSGSHLTDQLTMLFYKLQKKFLKFSIPQHAGTFSAFNRNFLLRLLDFQEAEIYFPGLRAYIGMNQTGISVERGKRAHGESKVGTMGLINLSMAGIIGFSVVPMRTIFLCGVLTTIFCFFLGIVIFLMKIIGITKVMGVTTVLIFMLGLFGLQIMFIGIVGEYIGKLFIETKKRPRWIIRNIISDK
jgi:polyisoprenyl-phosphate glycosyltransferase